jgi:tryptophanyl-tRNA synthetase
MHPSKIKADGTYPVVDYITYLSKDKDGADKDGAQVQTNSCGTIAVKDLEKAQKLLKRIQEVKAELKKKKKKYKDWHGEARDPPLLLQEIQLIGQ